MIFWDWVWSLLGVGLVALALVDVFHTLLFPSGVGPVCRPLMRTVWRLTKLIRGPAAIAGPLGMATIIATWTALAMLGWALIYYPHVPGGFLYQDGLNPDARPQFMEALYLSMVTVATLGFGDIVPVTTWLRLVAPLQALTGFALLTGAVSWIMQVYPALTRRRSLALQMTLARRAEGGGGLSALSPRTSAELLTSLAKGVVATRIDLAQFDETYYFREPDRESALPALLGYADRLASSGMNADDDDVRFAGRMLDVALQDLADLLESSYHHESETRDGVFKGYAAAHGQQQY